MSVGSVCSASGNIPTKALQSTPETAEVKKGGRDNDGDSDDGGARAVKSPPPPSVNMNGQNVGQTINVTA